MLTFKYKSNKAHSEEHATRNLILATLLIPTLFVACIGYISYVARTGKVPLPDFRHIQLPILFASDCKVKEASAVWVESSTAVAQDIYGYTYWEKGNRWERTGKNVPPFSQKTVSIGKVTYSVKNGKISVNDVDADLCG